MALIPRRVGRCCRPRRCPACPPVPPPPPSAACSTCAPPPGVTVTDSYGSTFDNEIFPFLQAGPEIVVQGSPPTLNAQLISGAGFVTLSSVAIAPPVGAGFAQIGIIGDSASIFDLGTEDFCLCMNFTPNLTASGGGNEQATAGIDLLGPPFLSASVRILFDSLVLPPGFFSVQASNSSGVFGPVLVPYTNGVPMNLNVCGSRTSASSGTITVIKDGGAPQNIIMSPYFAPGTWMGFEAFTRASVNGLAESATSELTFDDICIQAGPSVVPPT